LFEFKGSNDEFTLPTNPNSFEEIGNYEEGFITIRKELVTEGFNGSINFLLFIFLNLYASN
jgi:hypothetical protein